MDKIGNLGIIDVKGAEKLPESVKELNINVLQLGGSEASKQRDEIQKTFLEGSFIVQGGYVIAEDKDGKILHQWSDSLQLGKIPGGKGNDAALIELLVDAYAELAKHRHLFKELNKNKHLSIKEILKQFTEFDKTIIDHTSDMILQEWFNIVSKPAPRDIAALKSLAQKEGARPFIASWLDIDNKLVRDFVRESKGATMEEYENELDEKSSKKSKKKKWSTYYTLFEGNYEGPKAASIREFKEETGYELDSSKLEKIGVIYEKKLTKKGNIFYKERVIYKYQGVLGEKGKIDYSVSEQAQGLKLVEDKTAQEIYQMMASGLDFKLMSSSFWDRIIGKDKKRTTKLSSAVVTYLIMSRYNNIYQKSNN